MRCLGGKVETTRSYRLTREDILNALGRIGVEIPDDADVMLVDWREVLFHVPADGDPRDVVCIVRGQKAAP